MTNQKHLDILKQGVEEWSQWRCRHIHVHPDLSSANLSGADLSKVDFYVADLSGANLSGANLSKADLGDANLSDANLSDANLSDAYFGDATLSGANLSGANLTKAVLFKANLTRADLGDTTLSGADLSGANLTRVDLSDANLSGANLSGANLSRANLSKANLKEANLSRAMLVSTNFAEAILTDCHIYGIAAWDVEVKGAAQNNLIITSPPYETTIFVDTFKLAQFISLLLNNAGIRDVIDTITSKFILLLGCFPSSRRVVLNALREELRQCNYSPVVCDIRGPESGDLTETVSTLAHLARFIIIVDETDLYSEQQHVVATVISQTVVPVQPVIPQRERQYSMFRDLSQKYPWVLPTHYYTDQAHLLATLQEHVIAPVAQKAQELEER